MKILTITGARPQFIKASVVSRAIAEHPSLKEVIIHTDQHFDANLSAMFFEQLGLPRPDYQFDINSGSHGEMTARMLAEIEHAILSEKPGRVLVYGVLTRLLLVPWQQLSRMNQWLMSKRVCTVSI